MKRFFLCLGLLLLPLIWSFIVLIAGFFQLFENNISAVYQLSFLCMGGCLCLAVLFSIFAQAFSSKICGIFGLIWGSIHFFPIFADLIELPRFNGFASYFSLGAFLISVLMFLMMLANSIIVFCRKKKPAAAVEVAVSAPMELGAFVTRLNALESQMTSLEDAIKQQPQPKELNPLVNSLMEKCSALEEKVNQLAQQKAAAPIQEAPAPIAEKPVEAKAAPAAEEPVNETPAPAAEESVNETPAPAPVPAVVPTAPAARKPIEYVLYSNKGTCTITEEGIRYQLKDQDFFAPYNKIDNLYFTLGVPYVMYKGKDYHIDVYQRNGQEKGMLKAAMAFGQDKWNAAKAQAASAIAVATNPNAPIYTMDNKLGTLKVYDTYCLLTAKKNATTLLVTNKFYAGEKKFYYSDLTSVQFREPGSITDGYLEFETPGARSSNNSNAYTSENAISFAKPHLPLMREIYTFIDGKIRECKERKNQPAMAALSPADELKKYKELLDDGIVTQEEFNQKKKQLLGL